MKIRIDELSRIGRKMSEIEHLNVGKSRIHVARHCSVGYLHLLLTARGC